MAISIILTAMIILSAIAVYFGFYCKKYSFDENKKYINMRSFGLLILALGYVIHTLGDYLSVFYGEKIELLLESSAHIIILVSFVFFIISAKEILKKARRYWFK